VNRADYLVGTGEAGVRLGAAFGVVPDVHVADAAFRRHREAQGGDPEKALNHYLYEGRVDAEFVRDVIAEVQGAAVYDGRLASPMTILDFASGYGRVARHMKNVVPNGKIVAIDLEETAMYFNTAHLGLQAAVFDADPARVSSFFEFDVVVALSFLRTQHRSRIGMWLEALAGFTKPAGIVLLTMPGAATPFAMMREIERVPRLDLVLYRADATRGHDDLYVLRRAA